MQQNRSGRLLDTLRLKETWLICFLCGLICLNYPFVQVFSAPVSLAGIPLLFLYLMGGWWVSILVIRLFVRALDLPAGQQNGDGER